MAFVGVRNILHKHARVGADTIPSLARLRPRAAARCGDALAASVVRSGDNQPAWVGQADIATTVRYLAVDLMAKRTSMHQAQPAATAATETATWHTDTGILAQLESR